MRTSTEDPPLVSSLCVSLGLHVRLERWGGQPVLYISAILCACMYNICTSDSVWMFWCVDIGCGCLDCPRFLFLLKDFLPFYLFAPFDQLYLPRISQMS